MSTSIFAPPGGANRNAPIVEFRAGKMYLTGNQVKADARKGLLSLTQEPSTGLVHITWKDRTTGKVEDDFILFPEEAQFERVQQCTTGRVYVLDFKGSERKHFFWMQEPHADKDEENAAKINSFINSPPPAGAPNPDPATMFNGFDPNILSMLTGGRSAAAPSAAPATPAPSTPAPTSSSPGPAAASSVPSTPQQSAPTPVAPSAPARAPAPPPVATPSASAGVPVQLLDLQRILEGMGLPTPEITGGQTQAATLAETMAAHLQRQQKSGTELATVLKPEHVVPLLASLDEERQNELVAHLPAETQTRAELFTVIRSAQFRHTLDTLTSVLNSPHASAFLSNMGLTPGLSLDGVESFLKAIQAQVEAESRTHPASPGGTAASSEKMSD